ncbi:MAG TPA: DUF305 domain-containing protein [Polyangiaceae bacterium]|nr:DUF305 domain-containing protein [Polyangiaceae bacterium]
MMTRRWKLQLRPGVGSILALTLLCTWVLNACDSDDDNGGSSTATGSTSTSGGGGSSGSGAGGGGGDSQHDAESVIGDRRIPYTPADDAAFAAFFAEHHRMAIEMAELEIEHGGDADVMELAAHIRDAQSEELTTLETAIHELGSGGTPPPEDPHAAADMDAMHDMSGAALDTMFLRDMIEHHAAGLASAHRSMANLERSELKQLAAQIFAAQAEEIGVMKEMLSYMGETDAGEDLASGTTNRPDFGLHGDRRIPLTPDDVAFIDFFVPHHEMAIAMAEEQIARGADTELKDMARSMRDTQQAEVDTMLAVRVEVAGSDAVQTPPHDPHMMAEMEQMEQLSGAELDRMFLEEMIPHHAAGLPSAHRAKPHVITPELQKLADDIYNAQAEEIGTMHQMLHGE